MMGYHHALAGGPYSSLAMAQSMSNMPMGGGMQGGAGMTRVKDPSEEPNLPAPWRAVQVLNSQGGVQDEYFWNTETNATVWTRPV